MQTLAENFLTLEIRLDNLTDAVLAIEQVSFLRAIILD
jgi:hypothetical protein